MPVDQSYDIVLGQDFMDNVRPYSFTASHFCFTYNNKQYKIKLNTSLITHPFTQSSVKKETSEDWVTKLRERWSVQLQRIDQRLKTFSSEDPLAFWNKSEWMIRLPALPITAPMKASHPGMSLEDTALCKQEIEDLLEKDLIEPSNSHWGCVAFYVNKHSEQVRGKKRLVINYKPLNQFLVPRKYPIPLLNDLLRRVARAKIFSKFDLKSGFWQFKVHPEDRHKTAFIVPQGMFQ